MPNRWSQVVLAAALLTGLSVSPVAAQTVEQLVQSLREDGWQVRHRALQRINGRYADDLPAAVREAVIDRLTLDAAGAQPSGEGYGEYLIDLVVAGLKTGDSRAVRPLVRVGGLGVTPATARFVASQGPTVLDFIDSVAPTSPLGEAYSVYAAMLRDFGSRLGEQDSARVLAALMGAASDSSSAARLHLVFDAREYQLAALYPQLAWMAAHDTSVDYEGLALVRMEAARSAAALQPLWNVLPPRERLHLVTLALQGACRSATGAGSGHCPAALAQLDAAEHHLAAGRARPAAEALRSARLAIAALASGPFEASLAGSLITGIRAIEQELAVRLPQDR